MVLDIGDNNGNNNGKNPFRIMKIYLDKTGAQTSYEAIPITDFNGQVIPTPLGRVDANGTSVFGPNGKIYFITYSPGYLIEFDPATNIAIGYPFDGLPTITSGTSSIQAEPYYISAGPPPSATNPSTLIYGGTFNLSLVWWFDPAQPSKGIQYIKGLNNAPCTDQEIDNRQAYVSKVIGKGEWIYVLLNKRDYDKTGDGGFKSVYAINTKNEEKFLLFHSTTNNFDIKAYKQEVSPNVFEDNIFLELDHGSASGTIYMDPVGININELPPSIAGANCPCYNIDPDERGGTVFPSYIRNNYITTTYYPDPDDFTGSSPENTVFKYNENYAWPWNNYTVIDPIRGKNGLFICNPLIYNGGYINLPWDIVNQMPGITIPNQTSRICFKITQRHVETTPINANNAFQIPWDSYDPYIVASGKPRTAWDEDQNTLYYDYGLNPLPSKITL